MGTSPACPVTEQDAYPYSRINLYGLSFSVEDQVYTNNTIMAEPA